MQVATESNFIIGTYKFELRNRFLCNVQIDDEDVVCYVPSSCHLSNFLQLEGKRVLLVPTKTCNSRTSLALFAVPYKRNYIILNTSIANRAMEYSLRGKRFAFLGKRNKIIKEHLVDGYKADLYLPETNTILEIKSIISSQTTGIFPTVYSERTLKQLQSIYHMLLNGYKVCFAIVSLHPYVKKIQIDSTTDFYLELMKCIEAGLILKGYTCRLHNDNVLIDKEISVCY